MIRRPCASFAPVMGALLASALLTTVACGGAEAPQETRTAAPTSGDSAASPAQQQAQPQNQGQSQRQTAAEPTATSVPQAAGEAVATPTPLPAALPSAVVANPITKDVYPDAQWGGILRRGGYGDPAHYDLMQVSSVVNSFKQRRLTFFSGTPVVGGPVIADGRAYFVTNRGGVWAVDPAAVSRPFSRFAYIARFNFFYWRLLKTPPRQTGTVWVASAQGRVKYSPAYANGRLFIVNENNKVTAFDGAGGQELWEAQLEKAVVAEPVAAGDFLVLGTADGALIALNVADGAEAWRHTLGDNRLSAAPAVSGETLYAPTTDGRLVALTGSGGSNP